MAVAPILEETPEIHIEELNALVSDNRYSRIRVRDLAEYYLDSSQWGLRPQQVNSQLLHAFKSAARRFELFGDPLVQRAINTLRDPTGW